MELDLAGRVAVVTGASKGIGLAVTSALAGEGVRVVAGALHGSPELDALSEKHDVHPVQVDLSDPDGPGILVAAGLERFGRLDILVNNVGGVRPRVDGFLAITDDEWEWTLTLNFLAAARTMRAALPALLEQEGACIVTISSVNAFLPDPAVIDYSAAKAALASFSKSLSKELGPRGVRVNTVSPGPVATDLWLGEDGVARTLARAGGGDPDAIAGRAASGSVTGRFPTPHEVADLVVLLASGRAGNTTGADFVIDGGLVPTL
jgi:NAD(P)-dependent dehydrogenase (short-subunit alcohol dehydrogenase family)